jgi:hypothetical protein
MLDDPSSVDIAARRHQSQYFGVLDETRKRGNGDRAGRRRGRSGSTERRKKKVVDDVKDWSSYGSHTGLLPLTALSHFVLIDY